MHAKSCYYTLLIAVPALAHSSCDNGFPWDCEILSRFFLFFNCCLLFFGHVQTTFCLFGFGCVGSLLLCVGLWRAGATLLPGTGLSHCSGFSCCVRSTGSRCTGSVVAAYWLEGVWASVVAAYWLEGVWASGVAAQLLISSVAGPGAYRLQ